MHSMVNVSSLEDEAQCSLAMLLRRTDVEPVDGRDTISCVHFENETGEQQLRPLTVNNWHLTSLRSHQSADINIPRKKKMVV